jgi:hypothetical protein
LTEHTPPGPSRLQLLQASIQRDARLFTLAPAIIERLTIDAISFLNVRRRLATGSDVPEAQVRQGSPIYIGLVDETDDSHLPAAFGSLQRVDLPYALDTLAPGSRWYLARPNLAYLQYFNSLARNSVYFCNVLSTLCSIPARPVGIPTILTHPLKRFFRYLLGDRGVEFFGAEDLEIPPVLAVGQLRFVDNLAAEALVVNLLQRKRLAQNVLGQSFLSIRIIAAQLRPVVNTEAGPAQDGTGQLLTDLSLHLQHFQHRNATRPDGPGQTEKKERHLYHQAVSPLLVLIPIFLLSWCGLPAY